MLIQDQPLHDLNQTLQVGKTVSTLCQYHSYFSWEFLNNWINMVHVTMSPHSKSNQDESTFPTQDSITLSIVQNYSLLESRLKQQQEDLFVSEPSKICLEYWICGPGHKSNCSYPLVLGDDYFH
jgi:hypothetical protein